MADLDNVSHLPTAARVLTADGAAPLGSATNPFCVAQVGGGPRAQEHLFPDAAGTNYHTQFAAGSAINATSGFSRFVPARTVQIVRGGAGVATVYTVTAVRFGVTVTETLHSNGATTVQGSYAYDTITSLTSDVNPGTTTDLQTGPGLGIGSPFSALLGVGVDGVYESPASSHGPTGTVIPTTAPDNNHVFSIAYTIDTTR